MALALQFDDGYYDDLVRFSGDCGHVWLGLLNGSWGCPMCGRHEGDDHLVDYGTPINEIKPGEFIMLLTDTIVALNIRRDWPEDGYPLKPHPVPYHEVADDFKDDDDEDDDDT